MGRGRSTGPKDYFSHGRAGVTIIRVNLPETTKTLEAGYYAERAAEAEQRRLAGKKKSIEEMSEQDVQAGYILWLGNEGFKAMAISRILDLPYAFVYRVHIGVACCKAQSIKPPEELMKVIEDSTDGK